MKETPIDKLKALFDTDLSYADICKKLNKEGFGYPGKSGMKRWDMNSLCYTLNKHGMRRYDKKRSRRAPAKVAAVHHTSASKVLSSVRSLLNITSMDPDERIALALLAIEGSGK